MIYPDNVKKCTQTDFLHHQILLLIFNPIYYSYNMERSKLRKDTICTKNLQQKKLNLLFSKYLNE